MVCPKWVLTNSQPISIDDVITYLMKSIEKEETEGREFDIGGPDTLRYIDMMRRYAKVINKKFLKIIIIPFLHQGYHLIGSSLSPQRKHLL